MKNVVSFMERLGKDAQLKNLSAEKLSEMANDAKLTEAVHSALKNGNVAALEKMLNVRHKIVCMIAPAEPEQEPEDDDGENEKVVSAVSNG